MSDDAKIWEDFKKGNKSSLSTIYHNNINLLFRYGRKYCSDDELIKDTIQDLFFDLIRTRSNLGSTDNIRFYLIKAFRRRLVLNLNKQNNRPRLVDESELEPVIVYSPEEAMIAGEELTQRERLICDGLKEISPKQREILFYRFNCDFEYEEICSIMSLKYDSARKQVFRAIRALKEKLPDPDLYS